MSALRFLRGAEDAGTVFIVCDGQLVISGYEKSHIAAIVNDEDLRLGIIDLLHRRIGWKG